MKKVSILFFLCVTVWAQAQIKPVTRQRSLTDEVNVVRLAPRYTTTIRMPEAVSSVVVGDPTLFLAEHADEEPLLVFVKPLTEKPAESNLVITTVGGRQVSVVLRSENGGVREVDFVLEYHSVRTFLIEEIPLSSMEVAGTRRVGFENSPAAEPDWLDRMLEHQRRAPLPALYGRQAPSPESKGDYLRAGVSEVVDLGEEVVVLFSVVNPQGRAVEILPPQVQLAGSVRQGAIFKRRRWGTSEQLPVKDFRLSRRRLGPGERADGIMVFDRPSFKQSNETLFLQMAESGAVDKPTLAPIGFGVSTLRKEFGE
ncbi:MAG: hypothetical protein KIT09_15965 [Bryobacteraceae bacterium]|nr:hypothetical protein [Bryobacteraceae bacterium]